MKLVNILVLVLALSAIVSAGVGETINNLCYQARGMMPIIAFILIVFGGLVYAAGQVLGAEMRSRTTVWATTMVIGAILGLIIAASAPAIVHIVADAFNFDLETYPYTCEEMI
ncbi:MAG: hypothetical protein ACP5H8_02575 [Candidatus Micrarchaeia archaeon]